MSDSLWPHGLQHTRLLCPSPPPRPCSNRSSPCSTDSCLLSQWYHPVSPSPPAFNLSQHQGLFQWVDCASGDQIIGASALASVPSNEYQDWFPLGLTGWISCSPRGSQESSPTPQFKASILWHSISAFLMVQLSHPYMTTGKTVALTRWSFVDKVISLLLICCLGWS